MKNLKLTKFIISIYDIYKIEIHPEKYSIFVSKDSSQTSIEICKTEHSLDYEIVSDWIDKN